MNPFLLIKAYQKHSQHMPQNIRPEMIRSFVGCTVAATVFRGGDLRRGFLAGAMAATAVAVDAFLTPFFDKFSSNQDGSGNLTLGEKWCRQGASLIIVGCLATVLGYPRVIHGLMMMVLFNGFYAAWDSTHGNNGRASFYIVL